ncbi:MULTISPECIES: hydrogenase maturation nickel metallochaperone HypA [Acidobacterium]|uniref:Hydrogenase maturation factor HypA n=1 Tax=Acidobacterium capsulatum (strain ATCC 51196 / DSM 11244 / BCRC 80197 / JCM 7670 / NBRC 15755 / NCIMB 13165 / 161) TaxID=240015 RepID=C1F4L3_ACIC5|nr:MULTISPECIES: hydrogenase maturation nickel metallochaperone HypA [Acidobacterium]ACO34401.1 putative hydrogenase nickel insertion protein HypA [Acidobacterium capsulatum ATCC 51196]HCT61829.1 hydrogenase maturation nickel metallochaperone HypA [Acidobacterium sp.]
MHEVGIANAILEAAQTEVARLAGTRLTRVGVRIGVLSGVDIDALEFALAALRKGTELEKIDVELQKCPRRNRCAKCGCEFETDLYSEPCPSCANEQVQLIGGEELELAFVEVDEA